MDVGTPVKRHTIVPVPMKEPVRCPEPPAPVREPKKEPAFVPARP